MRVLLVVGSDSLVVLRRGRLALYGVIGRNPMKPMSIGAVPSKAHPLLLNVLVR